MDEDERIILESRNVKFKSILFDAILTNKRIHLTDSKKNVIPSQDIALTSIRNIERGENAIRDHFLILSLINNAGEQHREVLTFARQSGVERKRECNEWAKKLNSLIPQPAPVKSGSEVPEVEKDVGVKHEVPVPAQGTPANTYPTQKNMEITRSMRTGSEKSPVIPQPTESGFPPPGSYCSQCGNRVPQKSTFCSHCGIPIKHLSDHGQEVQPVVIKAKDTGQIPTPQTPVTKVPDTGQSPTPQPTGKKVHETVQPIAVQPVIKKVKDTGQIPTPQTPVTKVQDTGQIPTLQPTGRKVQDTGQIPTPQPLVTKVQDTGQIPTPQPAGTKVPDTIPSLAPQPTLAKVKDTRQLPASQPVITKVKDTGQIPTPQPVVPKVKDTGQTPAPQPNGRKVHETVQPIASQPVVPKVPETALPPVPEPVVPKVPETALAPAPEPVVPKVPETALTPAPEPVVPKVPETAQPPAGSPGEIESSGIPKVIHPLEPLLKDSQLTTRQHTDPVQQSEPASTVTPHASSPPIVWPSSPSPRMIPAPEGKKPNYITIGILIMAILPFLVGLVIVANIISGPTADPANTTPQIPTPTSILNQSTTQAIIPSSGIWVKVSYTGAYIGLIGSYTNQTEVSDTGDHIYPIPTGENSIFAAIQKTDSSENQIVLEVYRNGVLLKNQTSNSPKAIVEIQLDYKT